MIITLITCTRYWTNSSSRASCKNHRKSLFCAWYVPPPLPLIYSSFIYSSTLRSHNQIASKIKKTARTRWHGWAHESVRPFISFFVYSLSLELCRYFKVLSCSLVHAIFQRPNDRDVR